jgi:hypothetical protein
MTRVRTTTYWMEERLAGRPAEKWCRDSLSRAEVFALFDSMVADDAVSDAPVFGPRTGHRLVVLAEGTPPLNREATEDLLSNGHPLWRTYRAIDQLVEEAAAARELVSTAVCRHCCMPIEAIDGGRRWRHLHRGTLTGTRHMTCGFGGERGTKAEPVPAVTR